MAAYYEMDGAQIAEFERRMSEFVDATLTSIANSYQAMLDSPAGRQFFAAIKAINDALLSDYRAAGAPHGDTEEGLQLWLEDQRAIRQAEALLEEEQITAGFREDGRRLGERLRQRYYTAGAPYGLTWAGCERWLDEQHK